MMATGLTRWAIYCWWLDGRYDEIENLPTVENSEVIECGGVRLRL